MTNPNDTFLCAIRESGRWLSAECLGVPFVCPYLTIKPYQGVASDCFLKFHKPLPVEMWAHVQLGRVVADAIYTLTDIRNAHLAKYQTCCWSKITPQALKAVHDVIRENTHPDIVSIRRYPGFHEEIFDEAVKLSFCSLSDGYAFLLGLAEELVARESMFWEEIPLFLDSKFLETPPNKYRRIRKVRAPLLVNGAPLRPDLSIPQALEEIVGPGRDWTEEEFRRDGCPRSGSYATYVEARFWEE